MSSNPESIKQLLSSENFGDRIQGLNQLRQLEKPIAWELIQPAFTDSNTRVRYAAISQMDTLGMEDLPSAFTILRDRLLNDPEPDVQAAAADAIGALKLNDAFPDLEKLYQTSSEWIVQFSIIAALGEMGDPRAFDLLKLALTSSNNLIQTAAVSSLGELGDPRAVSLIAPLATNPDWQLRYRIVQALNQIGGPEIRSILETLANDRVEQVAEEAKNYLQAL